MVCLRFPDGTITRNQRKMMMHVVDFFGTLNRVEDCSRECQDELQITSLYVPCGPKVRGMLSPTWTSLRMTYWGMVVLSTELKLMNSILTCGSLVSS